jgi:hypothetical protein
VPEKKVRVAVPGLGPVDAYEVGVMESTERWTELKLEDGSVLRVKPLVSGAIRIEGKFDAEGNPVYSLKATQITTIVSVPEHLKEKPLPGQKAH